MSIAAAGQVTRPTECGGCSRSHFLAPVSPTETERLRNADELTQTGTPNPLGYSVAAAKYPRRSTLAGYVAAATPGRLCLVHHPNRHRERFVINILDRGGSNTRVNDRRDLALGRSTDLDALSNRRAMSGTVIHLTASDFDFDRCVNCLQT